MTCGAKLRPGRLGGRSFAAFGVCCTNARHGMIEPTCQRPRHRGGLPRAARICGGRLPRCRATAIFRRAAFWPKCGRTRVSAFRRRAGGPVPKPTRGRPHPGNGLPRAARICGGRLPRCRATAVLPPIRRANSLSTAATPAHKESHGGAPHTSLGGAWRRSGGGGRGVCCH